MDFFFCLMPVKTLLNYLTVLLLARRMSTTSKLSFFFMEIPNSGHSKHIIIPIAVNYSTLRERDTKEVSFFPVPSVVRMCLCL